LSNPSSLRVAALFSGGKDSTYAIHKMMNLGHEVVCILTIIPKSDESMFLHYPNIELARYLADAMQIPYEEVHLEDQTSEKESIVIQMALEIAVREYMIDGIVHGAISSVYQKNHFERLCSQFQISVFSPLWGFSPKTYMHKLVESNFSVVITSVSSLGLNSKWLGKTLDRESLNDLEFLAEKYGFSLDFEGGEAETIVTDCPIFRKKLVINDGIIRWYGDRGIFEIEGVQLIPK
jgi:ABC transporter with metal-binding/Fe-S-binding domain ATP-binding protein